MDPEVTVGQKNVQKTICNAGMYNFCASISDVRTYCQVTHFALQMTTSQ